MSKVKMREFSSKKKKSLRDLTSRISLPPELKNGFSLHKQQTSINNTNNNNNSHHQSSANNLTNKMKMSQHQQQRASYYQTSSLSTQALNQVLHQSNSSLLRLSPSTLNTSSIGQLSRNEQRLSMLDLGFGKIESYIKLEKLGEGKTNVLLFSFDQNLFFFSLLRNLCDRLQGQIAPFKRVHRIERNSFRTRRRCVTRTFVCFSQKSFDQIFF